MFVAITSTAAAEPERPRPVDPFPDAPTAPPPPEPQPPPPEPQPRPPDQAPAEAPPPEPAPPEPATTSTTPPEPPEDPDTITPDQLPDAGPPPRVRYPRSFVDRPLLLPNGLKEGSVGFHVGRETVEDLELKYLGVTLGGRLPVDATHELSVGADFTLFHDDNAPVELDIPKFRRLALGLRWGLGPDTLVGVQGVIGNLTTKFQRYSPSLFAEHKIRTSERGAIHLSGGVDYEYQKQVAYEVRYALERLGAFGAVVGLIQVTPVFALKVTGSAAALKYIDDYHPKEDTFVSLSASAGLLVSATERIDVLTYFAVTSIDEVDIMVAGLTLFAR